MVVNQGVGAPLRPDIIATGLEGGCNVFSVTRKETRQRAPCRADPVYPYGVCRMIPVPDIRDTLHQLRCTGGAAS